MSLRDNPRIQQFLHPETDAGKVLRDVTVTVVVISTLALVLYAVGGVWPPFFSVTSGSMEPEMERGDLILIEDPLRDSPEESYGPTGIVTVELGTDSGYRTFGGAGDVIIFKPDGSDASTPIIHRAHFWVEGGENWYGRANPEFIGGVENCEQLPNCPAPNAGFITKGDANNAYDQALEFSRPVQPEWVLGEAKFRIPYLGWVRIVIA